MSVVQMAQGLQPHLLLQVFCRLAPRHVFLDLAHVPPRQDSGRSRRVYP